MRISRHFASALFGISMTLLAWTGPWEWPGWPATILLDRGFGPGFADLEDGPRTAAFVLLIAVNVAAWAALANIGARVWSAKQNGGR